MKYTNAISYFKSADHDHGFCEEYQNTESSLDMLNSLIDAGVLNINIELDDDFDEPTGALYITLPKKISKELLIEVAYTRPHEISEEDNGTVRIWWD